MPAPHSATVNPAPASTRHPAGRRKQHPFCRHLLWLTALLGVFLGALIWTASATARELAPINPLADFEGDRWAMFQESLLGDAKYRLDGDLDVQAPVFGEDSASVPVTIEFGPSLGKVAEAYLLVDHNPFPVIAKLRPQTQVDSLSLRIRMERSSPVRVVARTEDGQWYAAGRLVHVAGGGCSVGGGGALANDRRPIGHVRVAAWGQPERARVRFQVMHPMDTGLATDDGGNAIPPFYVFNFDIRAGGRSLMELETSPIAQNPTLTVALEVPAAELAQLQVVATDSRETLYMNEEVILFWEPGASGDIPPQAAAD